MKTIDFIVSYLKTEATEQEKDMIKVLFTTYKTLPIEHDKILEYMIGEIRKFMRQETPSKLNAVKFVKDVTGWGLKDCKEWIDYLTLTNMI